ncbi:GH25 family lysozyme [Aquimarina hainanensis]|uniref:GH25 family lysozyme n=1 Tax=Aquimarina hainanensis TaxID=1578017 RepID=A0ABW5NBZ6_9FLAO
MNKLYLLLFCFFVSILSCKKQKTNLNDAPILGIDISHYQGNINWKKIKKDGVSFCYAKATQGTSFVDPKFKTNQKQAKKIGLKHGSYHFFMAGKDPRKQADLFIQTVVSLNEGDMIPMLDLEQEGLEHHISAIQFQKDVLLWLSIVEDKLGIKPIIYTNNPFGNTYLTDSKFASYKLWIAEYQVKTPKTPSTWAENGWTIWQRSERGKVYGIQGKNVDHDIVNKKYSLQDIMYTPDLHSQLSNM